jgi:D-sedoheptulose 7-phosphate isomerase
MSTQIKELIAASVLVKQNILSDEKILSTVQDCISVITAAFNNGNKVLFCGNGGSAADAQHLAAEFSGRFYIDRAALPSEALHCNSSYLTAVANDYSYDAIYSRMIEGIGKAGDVLVGLSTSGNSKNIVKAFEVARQKEMVTIGLTGETGWTIKIIIRLPA